MAIGDVNSNERGSGARFNDGKVRYELIPTHLLESTARVLDFGAKKYAAWNWAKGMPFSVVIGCLKRHLAAIERGEDYDPETGLRHTGHIGANLLFLEHYMNEFPELDDRPKEWFNNTKEQSIERHTNPELPASPPTGKLDLYPLEQRGLPNVREDLRTPYPNFSDRFAGARRYPTTERAGVVGAYDSSGFGSDGHTT